MKITALLLSTICRSASSAAGQVRLLRAPPARGCQACGQYRKRPGAAGPAETGRKQLKPSGASGHQHVADAAQGTDDLRLLRVVLELAAQAGDADADGAIEGVPVAVLGQVEQLVAGQRPVRTLGEGLQQVELHGGQIDLPAVLVQLPAALQIQPEAPQADGP